MGVVQQLILPRRLLFIRSRSKPISFAKNWLVRVCVSFGNASGHKCEWELQAKYKIWLENYMIYFLECLKRDSKGDSTGSIDGIQVSQKHSINVKAQCKINDAFEKPLMGFRVRDIFEAVWNPSNCQMLYYATVWKF